MLKSIKVTLFLQIGYIFLANKQFPNFDNLQFMDRVIFISSNLLQSKCNIVRTAKANVKTSYDTRDPTHVTPVQGVITAE